MTHQTTTHLGLVTAHDGDRLPESVTKTNFETIDQYVAARVLTNKSGLTIVANSVVIADTTADTAFTTTTTVGYPKVVGVTQASIIANATGIVKQYGVTSVLVTGATSRGDWLRTSTTAGQAEPVTATDPPGGAFAIALSATVGAGTVTALLLTTATVSTGALPASAAPSVTTEGYAEWDSDDDLLKIGTGAAKKTIGLSRSAGLAASATQETAYDTTAKALKVWDGASSFPITSIKNYKSSTQVFTTNTTLADVTGALAATFSFAIGANEVWEAEYYLTLAFGGTGGLKTQLTGPAAPTSVVITGTWLQDSQAGSPYSLVSVIRSAVTAFSSNINAINSQATATTASGLYPGFENTADVAFIRIHARIINGANAGTVTLQAAQNSSNSTTTLGLGSFMRAERIA